MLNSSGATTPGQSGLVSNGNEKLHSIPQSFNITGATKSDCLVLYPGYLLAEMQSAYSTVPADWFGLVSLFNGISTFVGYLMPKQFSEKNSSGTT